jgi:hypothetical protein
MLTANLHGNQELIFKQSIGRPVHIIVNAKDLDAWLSAGHQGPFYIETYCNRKYKYGLNSETYWRDAVVRNACEDCFITYEPRIPPPEKKQEEPGLPF